MHNIEPDLILARHEQAALATIVSMEGFAVIQRIFRSEVDKYYTHFINADTEDASQVLERHRLMKVAAQLFEGITQRIRGEIEKYVQSDSSAVPIDPTEGMLDFGPHASRDMSEIQPFEEGVL